MSEKIKWGILGPGKIAHKFVQDLLLFDDAIIHGIASRDKARAATFAKAYDAIRYYGSYEELAHDPEIDVIYISTPHVFHFDHSMLCLQNHKAVICEKPFGMNVYQVDQMIREAEKRKIFLMEALWTRFIPGIEKVLELIDDGQIGKINNIRADFGFLADSNPAHRLYNAKLGGGALLDIGIYPVYLSMLLLGVPDEIKALASMSETKIDKSIAILFKYHNGQLASLDATFEAKTSTEAIIYGDKGSIHLHSRFHHPQKVTLKRHHHEDHIFHIEYIGNGYYHEISEVMNCLKQGKIQSDKMPHQKSRDLIKILDAVRCEVGLIYDSDSH